MKRIGSILKEIEDWMKKHDFNSINQFKSKLSQRQSDRAELYERLQYIKALTEIE